MLQDTKHSVFQSYYPCCKTSMNLTLTLYSKWLA